MTANDDAPGMPKGVVTASHFDWQNDQPPETPLHDSDHLRGAREGLHRRGIRTCRRICAALTLGLASRP